MLDDNDENIAKITASCKAGDIITIPLGRFGARAVPLFCDFNSAMPIVGTTLYCVMRTPPREMRK